ncbi:hypothetical protein Fmac_014648 [Flemingia macrophylla]|uniref:Uncharacterized protein n=1 Tax=Flemingia macrophylla TaxID=520843 RepID=A0ABD1MCD4_9FABA
MGWKGEGALGRCLGRPKLEVVDTLNPQLPLSATLNSIPFYTLLLLRIEPPTPMGGGTCKDTPTLKSAYVGSREVGYGTKRTFHQRLKSYL